MEIVFLESLGMCECKIAQLCEPLKAQGHHITFYPDRNEKKKYLSKELKTLKLLSSATFLSGKVFWMPAPV